MWKPYLSLKAVLVDTEQTKVAENGEVMCKVKYSDDYESWVPARIFNSPSYVPLAEAANIINEKEIVDPVKVPSTNGIEPAGGLPN